MHSNKFAIITIALLATWVTFGFVPAQAEDVDLSAHQQETMQYGPNQNAVAAGPHNAITVTKQIVYWTEQPQPTEVFAREGAERRPWLHYCRAEGVEGKAPGIILLHGGGYGAGSPDGFLQDSRKDGQLALLLASHGYNVYAAGYTLGAGSGKYFAAIDLHQTVRFIRQHAETFGQDPDRLGAWGFSAGAMTLSQMLVVPERSQGKITYRNEKNERVRQSFLFDGGPLLESDLSSRLQVMVFSSGFDIRPNELAKAIKTSHAAGYLPDALISYQSPGEKPRGEGQLPPDHEAVQALHGVGMAFESYGVPGGKHCPGITMMIDRDGVSMQVWDAVRMFLAVHLKKETAESFAAPAQSSSTSPSTSQLTGGLPENQSPAASGEDNDDPFVLFGHAASLTDDAAAYLEEMITTAGFRVARSGGDFYVHREDRQKLADWYAAKIAHGQSELSKINVVK